MEGTVFLDERAPIILAALNEAGFEIVQRPTIKCSQCNDTGVIWPEHGHGPSSCIYCWIRRAEPLPPTPGPFNPFGKQDDE